MNTSNDSGKTSEAAPSATRGPGPTASTSSGAPTTVPASSASGLTSATTPASQTHSLPAADYPPESDPFYYVDKIQQAIDSSEDPEAQLHLNGETKDLPLYFNFASTPRNQIWNWFLKLDKEAKVLKPKTSKGIGLFRRPEYARQEKHMSPS